MTQRQTPKRLSVFILWAMAVALVGAVQYLPGLINPAHSILNARFKTLWSQPVTKLITTTPVIMENRLVYGTSDGELAAITLEDGKHLWSLQLPDGIYAVTASDKMVYATTGSHFSTKGILAAVNVVSGQILWQKEFEGHLEEPLLVDAPNHRLWLGGGPSGLWSVDTRDGSVLWNKRIGHLDGTPLLHENVLYIPAQKDEKTLESFFYALSADDGREVWKKEIPGQPWAAPVIDKAGIVIFTTTGIGQIGVRRDTDKGWAQAFSISGELLWQTQLPAMALTPGLYQPDQERIIYTTKGAGVLALDIRDGSIIWRAIPDQEFYTQAVLIDHFKEPLLAATTGQGMFYLLDALDGRVLYSLKSGNQSYCAPVVHDETFYVTTSHNITAFSDE